MVKIACLPNSLHRHPEICTLILAILCGTRFVLLEGDIRSLHFEKPKKLYQKYSVYLTIPIYNGSIITAKDIQDSIIPEFMLSDVLVSDRHRRYSCSNIAKSL
jgi:hypothetical protein